MANLPSAALKWMASSGISKRIGRALPERLRHLVWQLMYWSYTQSMMRKLVNDKTILLADYPRSGVVWLRNLTATVAHFEATGEFRKFSTEEAFYYAPTLMGGPISPKGRFANGGGVLKTHFRHHPKFKRGVIIFRNPFDAIKSIYALEESQKSRVATLSSGKRESMQAFFLHWIKEYIEIYQSWLNAAEANEDGFLFFCYEEMVADIKPFLPVYYRFLGFDPSTFPAGAIDGLAVMYSRKDVTTNTDEKLKRRDELQGLLDKDISPDLLARLDPELADRLNGVISKLMDWRSKTI